IASRVIVPKLSGVEADKVFGMVASMTMPNWLAAMAVAGGFTAAMSTVNGLVFGNATNISVDLYKTLKPDASQAELIRIARISVAAIMGVCTWIAWNPNTPVAELSVIAFGMVAVTIFPLWGAYFWKRATTMGAIVSTLGGAGLTIAFFFIGGKGMILNPQASFFQLNGFLVALIAAGVLFIGVSLATRPGTVEQKSLSLFFHPALNGNGVRIIDPVGKLQTEGVMS
ncbi:MAG TPA: sodium:solute symporter family protein, partial [Desulfatirhabdiaceae bacterium]|nr:sodium:solute symporter family protein [Desulfatirhabdiaceae bacterium]